MLKTFRQQIAMAALFFTLPIGSIFIGTDVKPAFAGCNIFGCSQSNVAECNPFGCPKPPSGETCTPFGCPESKPSAQPNQYPNQPSFERPNIEQPNSEQPSTEQLNSYQPNSEQPNPEVNTQFLQKCLDALLYRTEEKKPFPGWICVPNDVNCKTIRVRTEISENVAVQACQGSR
jgi:hypothetical protein